MKLQKIKTKVKWVKSIAGLIFRINNSIDKKDKPSNITFKQSLWIRILSHGRLKNKLYRKKKIQPWCQSCHGLLYKCPGKACDKLIRGYVLINLK